MSFFFFFQAEDGIRDKLVTGVQTCALPISPGPGVGAGADRPAPGERESGRRAADQPGIGTTQRAAAAPDGEPRRPRARAHARSTVMQTMQLVAAAVLGIQQPATPPPPARDALPTVALDGLQVLQGFAGPKGLEGLAGLEGLEGLEGLQGLEGFEG